MKTKVYFLFIFYLLNVTLRKLKMRSVAYILVCSMLLWDSPSQPNEISGSLYGGRRSSELKYPSSPRLCLCGPGPTDKSCSSIRHWTFDLPFYHLRSSSSCRLFNCCAPNCEPFRRSDLSLFSLSSASHFILPLGDSVHVHGFIYHLQTDDIQFVSSAPTPLWTSLIQLLDGWLQWVALQVPQSAACPQWGLWLSVPCLFLGPILSSSLRSHGNIHPFLQGRYPSNNILDACLLHLYV